MARQLRQGDVLLIRVASIPEGARRVKRRRGPIVLAAGEATGHAHQIDAAAADLLEASPEQRFLRVLADAGVELLTRSTTRSSFRPAITGSFASGSTCLGAADKLSIEPA